MVQVKLGVALDAIRRAALEPRAWTRVQATTEVLLGAFASQLATVDHREGNRFIGRTSVMPELDAELPHLMPCSEPVLWSAAHPHWRRMVDYDYIDEAGIRRSEFYARTRKYDAGYRLGLRLLDTPGISSALIWIWPQSAGHVQARELNLLKAIEHPLRLSASIAQQRWNDMS
ncbi:hypothetical protein, partial [Roseivivax halodurans]|uniref:hypothetical protein n=1 Tax=Roseivivax halodurans TaxID=93683 RepID=UPI00056A1CFD